MQKCKLKFFNEYLMKLEKPNNVKINFQSVDFELFVYHFRDLEILRILASLCAYYLFIYQNIKLQFENDLLF